VPATSPQYDEKPRGSAAQRACVVPRASRVSNIVRPLMPGT
jgi:hypothetical protein